MKVTVGGTLLNEEGSVGRLLNSLIRQSKKANEIIIVDGGSTDKTVEIVRHHQKKYKEIKLLVQKSNVAQGRNLCVELAKNRIIAMTDADCIADKNWLKRITQPFEDPNVDMVAGFYKMHGGSPRQKALSYFLGITPKRFDVSFLPSTRSVAFTKELWERVGGFPEEMSAGEDTVFNAKVVESGAKIARVKDAIVHWEIPDSIREAFNKFSSYAKWDIKSKMLFNPAKGLASHNLKAIMVLIRYLSALILVIFGFQNNLFWTLLFALAFLCGFWAFRKVYAEFQDTRTALWGIFWQIVTDLAVIKGFLQGIMAINGLL